VSQSMSISVSLLKQVLIYFSSSPIIQKLCGAGGAPGSFPGARSEGGRSIGEVDFSARISAKNTLESYIYNLESNASYLRITLSKLEAAINETNSWLDRSQKAPKEAFESKQKELEGVAKYYDDPLSLEQELIYISPPALSCESSTGRLETCPQVRTVNTKNFNGSTATTLFGFGFSI